MKPPPSYVTVVSTPAFEDIETHDDLLSWSKSYCKRARRDWVIDVRFDLVEWDVSTRAKRRAAAVKRPKIEGASVGDPLDWETAETADGYESDGRPFPCTMSLTWDAYDAYDRAEWTAILRHELVHVEQYQAYGTTDHGSEFRARASDLDTDVHCRTFSTPRYVLRCVDCDTVVARRYRDCKLVREYDSYRSSCCSASLSRSEPGVESET